MRAKVYKSTGSWYIVKAEDGNIWNARIRGIFKLDEITSTNPLAVGDDVELEPENADEKTASITEIYDRRNYINRQSPSHKMQHHIIAANIDQSLLICTLKEPRTSQGFIDRFLVACEAYHVNAILVFNKTDLYKKKEEDKFAGWKEMYEAIGYRIIRMSVQDGSGVEELKDTLRGRISLLSGHSGVGKSSFLNAIFPSLKRKTHEVSGWSGKGIHTTTFAEMFDLPADPASDLGDNLPVSPGGNQGDNLPANPRDPADPVAPESDLPISPDHPAIHGAPSSSPASPGAVIDTPGMREFGIVDISRQELSGYFPEMRALAGQCQFNNCLHMEEPGCMVKQAVRDGLIHEDRYVSYCGILDSIEEMRY